MLRHRRHTLRAAAVLAFALLACSRDAQRVEGFLSAGDQLLREGRPQEAVEAYDQAIELAAADSRPLRRKAMVMALQGKDAPALALFERARDLEPLPSAEELVFWGTSLQRSGRSTDAIEKYQAALRANPDHVPAMNNLASLLRGVDVPLATRLLEKAVHLEPGDAQIVYNLGRLYQEAGRLEEAYDLIQRSISALPAQDPARAARRAHLEKLGATLPRAAAPTDAPDILLVVVDTLRADHMSTYGYARKTTPGIDALAREGVVFERAVSQAPWTAPSMATLFTGLYPSVHGLDQGIDLKHSFDPQRESRPMALQKSLRAGQRTLAQALRRHGYRTVGFVSQIYLNSIFGFAQGFDYYRDAPFTTDKILGQKTNEAVFQWLEHPPPEPFFLFVHYNDPHFPYDPPDSFGKEWVSDYQGKLTPRDTQKADRLGRRDDLTDADVDYVRSLYDGEIAYVDSLVGALVEKVRAQPLQRDLILVLTADHGEEFLEHGGASHGFTLYEEQIRVPLLVHAPARFRPRRAAEQVRLVDLVPTLLELTGVARPPGNLQGQSFAELLRGPSSTTSRLAFSEATWEGDQESVRTPEGWKLIRKDEGQEVHLFDLRQDPGEQTDLAPARASTVETLERALDAWNATNERARAQAGAGESGAVVLDERTQRQLRALGYLK